MFKSCSADRPKNVLVSVKPSGMIKEGDKVTLTCESDANPKESYTWYKGDEVLLVKKETYGLPSIKPKDSGNYSCQSSNAYGSSTSLSPKTIDVQCKYMKHFHFIQSETVISQ